MKIFLFGYFEMPTGMAPVKRTMCLAKGLVSAGMDVEVDVIHWFFQGGQRASFPPEGEHEGVKYRFVNGEKRYKNGIELRLDLKWRDRRGAVKYVLENAKQRDVVYIYSGNNGDIRALTKAAHKKGAKAVLELVEIPYYNEDWQARFHRWIQTTTLFPKLDGFTCISEELALFAHKHASKRAKILKVPSMVESRMSCQGKRELDFPYIIHTGTMIEQKDGISVILKAFALMKCDDKSGCKLVFAGPHSNEKCSFIPLMKELGIYEDVVLMGMIKDPQRLDALQQNAAMSIVYRYDNLQTRCGFSTKLCEMLASGVPLITTPVGGHSEYLEDKKNSFIVEPGNIGQLSDAIRYVLSNPEKSHAIALAGKELADTVFSPQFQGKMLAQFFREL